MQKYITKTKRVFHAPSQVGEINLETAELKRWDHLPPTRHQSPWILDHFQNDQDKQSFLTGVLNAKPDGSDAAQALRHWVDSQTPPKHAAESILSGFPCDGPPDDWLVNGFWWLRGEAILLSGASGIGKSTLLLDLMCHWALGKSYMGLVVQRPLRILMIQGENAQRQQSYAVTQLMKTRGWDNDPDAIGMIEANFKTINEPDFQSSNIDQQLVDELGRHLSQNNYDIVVIDPLFAFVSSIAQDENEAVRQLIRFKFKALCKQHNIGGLIIHHQSKDGARNYKSDIYSSSGSAEMVNAVKNVISFFRDGDETSSDYIFRSHKRSVLLEGETEATHDILLTKGKYGEFVFHPRAIETQEIGQFDFEVNKNGKTINLLDALMFVNDAISAVSELSQTDVMRWIAKSLEIRATSANDVIIELIKREWLLKSSAQGRKGSTLSVTETGKKMLLFNREIGRFA